MHRFLRWILLAALLSGLLSPTYAIANERNKVDSTIPITAGLSKCTSADQLDCIVSVTVISDGGKRLPANQIAIEGYSYRDDNNQLIETGETTWQYTTAAGVQSAFILAATLSTPAFVVSGELSETELENLDGEANEDDVEATKKTEVVTSDSRYFEPKLNLTANFESDNSVNTSKKLLPSEQLEIVVRTSWLDIADVYLPGRAPSLKIDTLGSGKQLTMSGSEVMVYTRNKIVNKLTGESREEITAKPNFEFEIFHPSSTGATKTCNEVGYKLSSTDGTSLSMADENEIDSIAFNVSGSTYLPNRSLNKGFALIQIPIAWIACKFPESLLPFGEKFEVQVRATDGPAIEQKPTTKASVSNGILEIFIDQLTLTRSEILIKTDSTKAKQRKDQIEKQRIEAEERARAEAEAKLKAEEKARAEAEAKLKAEAEAKAKAESDSKKPETPSGSVETVTKAKQKTITCLKGKKTKKVTAVSPKCPKGYRKK
jgi:hypothetical protein